MQSHQASQAVAPVHPNRGSPSCAPRVLFSAGSWSRVRHWSNQRPSPEKTLSLPPLLRAVSRVRVFLFRGSLVQPAPHTRPTPSLRALQVAHPKHLKSREKLLVAIRASSHNPPEPPPPWLTPRRKLREQNGRENLPRGITARHPAQSTEHSHVTAITCGEHQTRKYAAATGSGTKTATLGADHELQ